MVRVLVARLGALGLIVGVTLVAATTKIGPVVVTLGDGRGLHALDVLLVSVSVPLAVLLLRSAEGHR